MRPSKHNHPLSFYAAKWHTTTTTAHNYAKRGCDWDASDYEVAVWLLKYGRKRSKEQRAAIYAVPGIDDPFKPKGVAQNGPPLKSKAQNGPLISNPKNGVLHPPEIDCHAFGRLMTLCCDTDAAVAKLKHGDAREALRLRRDVAKLETMTAKLRDENAHL